MFGSSGWHAITGLADAAVHDVEAFGRVSTLMPYDDLDEAVTLARGRGSLVGTARTNGARRAPFEMPRATRRFRSARGIG